VGDIAYTVNHGSKFDVSTRPRGGRAGTEFNIVISGTPDATYSEQWKNTSIAPVGSLLRWPHVATSSSRARWGQRGQRTLLRGHPSNGGGTAAPALRHWGGNGGGNVETAQRRRQRRRGRTTATRATAAARAAALMPHSAVR
jgi:hypothetical protein